MKKISIPVFLAFLLSTLSGFAQVKSISLEKRDSLQVQGSIEVNWIPSDSMRLHLEAIDGTFPNVLVDYGEGFLVIDREKRDLEEFEIKLHLYYPAVKYIKVTGSAILRSAEASQVQSLGIDLQSGGQVDIPVEVDALRVNASGTSQVILAGSCDHLIAEIKLGAYFDGYGLHCQNADIQLKSAVKMEIMVSDSLTAKVGLGSELMYGGQPVYKKIKSKMGANVSPLD